MDPQACWARMIDAIDDEDEYGAACAAEDLCCWIGGGGFKPENPYRIEELDGQLDDVFRRLKNLMEA